MTPAVLGIDGGNSKGYRLDQPDRRGFAARVINGVGVSAAGEVLRVPVGAISGDWGGGATPVEPLPRSCSPGLHEVLIVAILQPY